MALISLDNLLRHQVPHGDISIRAAGVAQLGVLRHGQCVTGRRVARERSLDFGHSVEVPDGELVRLSAHNQRLPVRQQFAGANVAVPRQAVQLVGGLWLVGGPHSVRHNVPDFDAALAAGVDVLGRVADGHGADHVAVRQFGNLLQVTRHAGLIGHAGRKGGWGQFFVCKFGEKNREWRNLFDKLFSQQLN